MHPFSTFGKDLALQTNSKLSPVPLEPLAYLGLVAHRLCYTLHRGFVWLVFCLLLAELLQLGEERHYLTYYSPDLCEISCCSFSVLKMGLDLR